MRSFLSPDLFSISDRHQFTVQPSVLEQDETGKLIAKEEYRLFGNTFGQKAYYNGERFNVSINGHGLLCQYSAPRIVTGSNRFSVGHGGLCEAIKQAEASLAQIGVKADYLQASLVRLDMFRNLEAEQTFRDYAPLFGQLRAKRQQKRDYGTTFLWHNKSQETCIYSKRDEMLAKGQDTAGIPDNLLRFELRYLKGQKIRASLPVATVAHLTERDRYEGIKRQYYEQMRRTVFALEPDRVRQIVSTDIRGVLKMDDKRTDFWKNLAVVQFQAQGFSLEDFSEAIRVGLEEDFPEMEQTTKRQTLHRYVSDYKAAQVAALAIQDNGKTRAELYLELFHKFFDDPVARCAG